MTRKYDCQFNCHILSSDGGLYTQMQRGSTETLRHKVNLAILESGKAL